MGHLKSLYHSKKIDLSLWVRPGQDQNIVFLTEFGENPPVATAINLRHIEDCSNQLLVSEKCYGAGQEENLYTGVQQRSLDHQDGHQSTETNDHKIYSDIWTGYL